MFAFASAPPLNAKRVDADEEEKKNKGKRLRESGQLLCVRLIRISPTRTQARFLRQVLGIHRFIYNECMEVQNNGELNGTGGTTTRARR